MITNAKRAIEIKMALYKNIGRPLPDWLHTLELRLGDKGFYLAALVDDIHAASTLPEEFEGMAVVVEKWQY